MCGDIWPQPVDDGVSKQLIVCIDPSADLLYGRDEIFGRLVVLLAPLEEFLGGFVFRELVRLKSRPERREEMVEGIHRFRWLRFQPVGGCLSEEVFVQLAPTIVLKRFEVAVAAHFTQPVCWINV